MEKRYKPNRPQGFHGYYVEVRPGEDAVRAYRKIKRKIKDDKFIEELRDRQYYQKPSFKKRERAKAKAKVLRKLHQSTPQQYCFHIGIGSSDMPPISHCSRAQSQTTLRKPTILGMTLCWSLALLCSTAWMQCAPFDVPAVELHVHHSDPTTVRAALTHSFGELTVVASCSCGDARL